MPGKQDTGGLWQRRLLQAGRGTDLFELPQPGIRHGDRPDSSYREFANSLFHECRHLTDHMSLALDMEIGGSLSLTWLAI